MGHGRQIHLARRDLVLRDVGEPLLVRRTRAEVAVQDVVGCRTNLAHVRAVSTTLARRGNQARLLHQTSHDLLRDVHGLIAQAGLDPPVAQRLDRRRDAAAMLKVALDGPLLVRLCVPRLALVSGPQVEPLLVTCPL